MKSIRGILLPLGAALLATLLAASGALQRLDRWTQDWLFQRHGVPSGNIIVIGIDEDALTELGPYHTWDRHIVASALEALASDPENKPAVTAVDVLYTGESDPEADAHLAKAARELGNVVMATMAEFGQNITWENGRAVSLDTSALVNYLEPYSALAEASVQGHINEMSDTDGVIRHALLYVEPKGQKVYSMAAETARIYLESRGEELRLPKVNSRGYFYIPFTGMPGDYSDGVSIAWLISGKVPSGYWKDKIVLIGPYATALQDAYFTPINTGSPMYGIEIQANVIQSMLEGNTKREIEDRPQLIILFVLCLAAMILFLRLKPLYGSGVCLGMIVLGIGGPALLYQAGMVTHPLWLPASAVVLYILSVAEHYLRAARERQALALEKERIDAELNLATRIQANSLPKVFPAFPDRTEFDLYASMTPAREVGGDLYDFFLIDDDHLALTIADVSGKGVPASLFMMVADSLIRVIAQGEMSPGKILTMLNRQICARNPEEMFVTVWLGVLELSTGKLVAANAGHEYPALKKPDGHFELVKDKHGLVIGAMDGVRYREYELQLEPGSKLFVYTDGVPEATSAAEELFGTDRMVEALQGAEEGSPEEILAAVDRAVQGFVGSAPQFDDLTMLCIHLKERIS